MYAIRSYYAQHGGPHDRRVCRGGRIRRAIRKGLDLGVLSRVHVSHAAIYGDHAERAGRAIQPAHCALDRAAAGSFDAHPDAPCAVRALDQPAHRQPLAATGCVVIVRHAGGDNSYNFV